MTKNYPRLQFFIMKNDDKKTNPKSDVELTQDFDKLWNFEPTEKRWISYSDALKIYIEDYKRDYATEYCFGKVAVSSENDEKILKVEQSPLFVKWVEANDHILVKNNQ